jgi:succinate dehydrogenase cytochrome b subunit
MTSQPEVPFLLDVFQRENRITMGKISKYITYRGGEGQWSWLLHRITGIGIFLFLLTHILDTAMIGWGPTAYNDVMAVFRHPLFRIGEVVLAGAVLYHALNGVRIIIIDFWPESTLVQKKLFYAVVVAFLLIFVPAAIYMLAWVVK